MKKLIIMLLLMQSVCFGQTKDSEFKAFLDFASSSKKLTTDIINDCEWHYALVKVNCNRSNKIVKYQILNTVPASINNFFKSLNGYKFNKNISINSHPVIFCIAFANQGTECILKNKSLAVQGATEMYSLVIDQIKRDPKSLFISDLISINYNYDPETKM